MKIKFFILIIVFQNNSAMNQDSKPIEMRIAERKIRIAAAKERIAQTKERIQTIQLKIGEYSSKKAISIDCFENKQKNGYEILFRKGMPKYGMLQKCLYTEKTGIRYIESNASFFLMSHDEMYYLYDFVRDKLSQGQKKSSEYARLCDDNSDKIEFKRWVFELYESDDTAIIDSENRYWTIEEALSNDVNLRAESSSDSSDFDSD